MSDSFERSNFRTTSQALYHSQQRHIEACLKIYLLIAQSGEEEITEEARKLFLDSVAFQMNSITGCLPWYEAEPFKSVHGRFR